MSIVGVDVGTMNLVSAKSTSNDKVTVKFMRNMFLPIDPEDLTVTELSDTQLDYAESKDDDGETDKIYILGEDAYKFANIFGRDVCRAMSKGVISSQEIDAIDVLTLMMEKLVGKGKGKGEVVYSVPAQAIDIDVPPVLYHEKVFNRIFTSLGYEAKPLNEALAIIYSECKNSNFSGIAISFGAGLTNIACAYKGTPTMMFSVSRGGDWIDQETASSLGILPTRVTSIKEKSLNFNNITASKKKERRVLEALEFYYSNLIDYVLKVITSKFEQESDGLDIDEDIPIIVSGGTSKPEGFVDIFKEVFSKHKDFPYEISEIRQADDPLTAVAKGCLIYAMWNSKNDESKNKGKE